MPTIKNLSLRSVFAVAFAMLAAGCSTGAPQGSQTAKALENMSAPALPRIPDKSFNIADYGAKADGKANDSAAIAKALDAAEAAGGGTVHFAPGTYLTGAVRLRSHVGLHLDKGAKILFSTNPADYPIKLIRWEGTECMNYSGLLYGDHIEDIAITGEGIIDGQGQTWWPWKDKANASMKKLRELGETTDDPAKRVFGTPEGALRPCLFEPMYAKRILLEGVTFTSSPFWTLHPTYCTDITLRKVTAIGTGPNTDGFDPDSCANILVEKSTFDTGDDCITLKSGRDRDGRRIGLPLENVVVRDCIFARGHGTVVIGSEMSGGVRNVLAENYSADGTDAGVRIKTRKGRGGIVENIVYRNITIKNIQKQAITIDMFYDVGNNPDVPQNDPAGIPIFRNILVENFKCEVAATSILIQGLPESPMSGIVLRNVQISGNEGVTVTGAPGTVFDNVVVTNTTTKPVLLTR